MNGSDGREVQGLDGIGLVVPILDKGKTLSDVRPSADDQIDCDTTTQGSFTGLECGYSNGVPT